MRLCLCRTGSVWEMSDINIYEFRLVDSSDPEDIRNWIRKLPWKDVIRYAEDFPKHLDMCIQELCNRTTSVGKILRSLEPILDRMKDAVKLLSSRVNIHGFTSERNCDHTTIEINREFIGNRPFECGSCGNITADFPRLFRHWKKYPRYYGFDGVYRDFIQETMDEIQKSKNVYYHQEHSGMFVETLPTPDIRWDGMKLPINPELWDTWTLSNKLTDHPELELSVRIVYIPDHEWDEFLTTHFPMDEADENFTDEDVRDSQWWDKMTKEWQREYIRAISYRGRIYIKRSAHRDRSLLLHELGHTVLFLDHTKPWEKSIMNPIASMRNVDGDNTR